MRLFLSGMMGTGKTSVGQRIAEQWGVPFFDMDASIEQRTQRSIETIFRQDGELGFRQIEREVILDFLDQKIEGVCALGGGAVTQVGVRRRLLQEACVVTLTASAETIYKRLAVDRSRPLLRGSSEQVGQAIESLLMGRAGAYAECHAMISTDDRDIETVARDVSEKARALQNAMVVPLGARTYPLVWGHGELSRLGMWIAHRCQAASRVIVVSDTTVSRHWAPLLTTSLHQYDITPHWIQIPPGESHKSLETVSNIWDQTLRLGIDRNACVVAFGGGVVGDLAGFVAATLLRGVRFVQVPTTLLAMVDSSVGGKTGFDHAQGKNLIGAFHQPCVVVCDPALLSTLPTEERIAGLAEVVKCAWLDHEDAVRALEVASDAIKLGDSNKTLAAMQAAVALKIKVVSADEFETKGIRALLNFGHTLGHAIEAATNFSAMRHGQAVALGMVAASCVSLGLTLCDPQMVLRLKRLLKAVGLPVDVVPQLQPSVWGFVAQDKKAHSAGVKWVLPRNIGHFEHVWLTTDQARVALETGLKIIEKG